ncbi:MAG: hypothetical protein CMJ85_11795 [Planctomycetes bacterium]|nr:hypothetical protein [Planctomycetota bacterium]
MSWLGSLNPLRAFSGYFERHPWHRRLLILAPILLLLALLNPVIGSVDKLLALVGKVLEPLINTGVGRGILLVLLLLLICVLVYTFARERVLNVLRRHALSMHLQATEALLRGEHDRARKGFARVLRWGRWIDLSKGPVSAYGSLSIDARLKTARIRLSEDDVRRARAELARIPRAALSKRLAFSYAELNARVFAGHPDHLPDSVLRVLDDSHKAWPQHVGIGELYADVLLQHGDGARAAEVLTETMRRTSKGQAPRVAERLARLHADLARTALHSGDLALAGKNVDRPLRLFESEEARLLKADVHLAKGNADAALAVLSDLATPAAKERLGALLRHEAAPLTPRVLLSRVPRRDSLVVLAEWYLENGEIRRAARALEVCLRSGPPSPRVLALLALARLSQRAPEAANAALERALTTLSARGAP